MTKLETNSLKRMLFATVPLLLGTGVCAHAAPVTFNFNTLNAGDNNATVQSYMQGVLNSVYGAGKVTVTVTGALADKGAVQTPGTLSWNGDGHTVGGNSGTPPSITLGNSDSCTGNGCTAGAADTYIRNNSHVPGLSGDPTSDVITMTFSGAGFTGFTNAGFDWEIFPDGSCTAKDGVNCGGAGNTNLPDFTFTAGATQSTTATVFSASGVVPGTGGTYSNSPLGAETAPQAIGTGSWAFASASAFQFQDWPATIGIDNLTFTPPSSVPEPGSVALLVTTVVGCYFLRRKRQKA